MESYNKSVMRLTPLPHEPPFLAPWPFEYLNELFFAQRDPRIMEYPLMSWLSPNLAIMFGYLAVVYCGPKLMKPYQAWSLKWPLVIYNFFMVLLSLYMLTEHLYVAYLSNYTLFCQPVDFSRHPLSIRMARITWMYFFTRYIEFVDTFFFILRKKNNQISFLHVYHHVSIAGSWWFTGNIAPGGMISYNLALNCFIHVIMYTYYGLSAFGPSMQKYLWWKVHLTKLQLLQFVCMLIIMSVSLTCDEVNFPKVLLYGGIVYCSSILTLFLNFYIQTYFFKKGAQKKVEGTQMNGAAVTNGKHRNNNNNNNNNLANGKKHK